MPHSISNLQTLHFPHRLRQHRQGGSHVRNQDPPSCSALGHHSLEQCIGAIFHYRQTTHDRRRPTSCRAQRRHSQCRTRRTQVPVCSLWIACLPYHLTKKFIDYIIFLTRLRLLTQAHKLCLFTLLRSGPGSFRDFPAPRIGAVATGRDPPAVFRGSGLSNVTCKVQVPVRDAPFYILHFTFYILPGGRHSSGGCGGGQWRGRRQS